jgi:hypothetical protein
LWGCYFLAYGIHSARRFILKATANAPAVALAFQLGVKGEKMNKTIQIIGISIAAIIMCGCASTGENLQRETAKSIGGNTSPEQVTVTNVARGATNVKWKATAPTGNYDCSADDMVRSVLCTKK